MPWGRRFRLPVRVALVHAFAVDASGQHTGPLAAVSIPQ